MYQTVDVWRSVGLRTRTPKPTER